MISEQRASLAGGVGVWGQGSPGVPGQAGEQCPRAAESEAEAQRAGELRGVLTLGGLLHVSTFLPLFGGGGSAVEQVGSWFEQSGHIRRALDGI